MRFHHTLLFPLVVAAAIKIGAQGSKPRKYIEVGVRVATSDGRPVAGLEKDAFQVWDAKSSRPIEDLSVQRRPTSIAIVYDVVDTNSRSSLTARQALTTFLASFGPSDEFMLITLVNGPHVSSEFTHEKNEVLQKIEPAYGDHDYLLDGIELGVRELAANSSQRRALLVITSEQRNLSEKDYAKDMGNNYVELYFLHPTVRVPGIAPEWTIGEGDRIAATIQTDYLLRYAESDSPKDGKWHDIRVELRKIPGLPPLKVTARPGYFNGDVEPLPPKFAARGPSGPTPTSPTFFGPDDTRNRPTDKKFVHIEPGEFMMGCSKGDLNCDDDETPPHRVKITQAFEIGQHEVTQAEWLEVMGSNPSRFKGPRLPVETVSWNDIQDFIRKMNDRKDGYVYRLPTEAEWEYAARAGTTGIFTRSDHVDDAGMLSKSSLDKIGWYSSNSRGTTHPIGQKPPNAWGLYDMQGNVWEWVQDWYSSSYYSASDPDNPQGPSEGQMVGSGTARGAVRVQRGGSWNDAEIFARFSARSGANPAAKDNLCGFRLVRTPQP